MPFFFILFLMLFSVPAYAAERDAFRPAWWCPGAHCQTVYGGLFRPVPDLPLYRERIEIPDGDFVDVDWLEPEFDPSRPVIVLLPGLGSNSGASYVRTMLKQIKKAGWQGVVINARGTSGETSRLKGTSHSGRTGDLDHFVDVLIQHRAQKIYLVGYSLGGNALLKWLGEKGDAVPAQVLKAIAVSVPYDLEKTSHELERGFNSAYQHNLLKPLIAVALAKEEKFPGTLDVEKVNKARTFELYDREVTAKLNGFKDEKDYWHRSSAQGYVAAIRRPVLLIQAANDPFLPEKFLPLEKIRANPNLELLLTRDGGHLGFVAGKVPWELEPWLEKTILRYFQEA